MAGPIVCDVCEQNPAAMLVTQLEAGDVMALCPHCTPDMLTRLAGAMSAALAGDGAPPPAEGTGEAVASTGATAEPEPEAANGKRRGRGAAATAAQEPEAEPEAAAH